MSDPYLGEIKLVSFNFAPPGWAECNGQILPIAQNEALFSVIGPTWGGDGIRTFALPNLQGRALVGDGTFAIGELGGERAHALTVDEMPGHDHSINAATSNGQGAILGSAPMNVYAPEPGSQMSPSTIGPSGSGQPHDNMQPYLVLNYIIAVQGTMPNESAATREGGADAR
jgi:microcystin-dependent protein